MLETRWSRFHRALCKLKFWRIMPVCFNININFTHINEMNSDMMLFFKSILSYSVKNTHAVRLSLALPTWQTIFFSFKSTVTLKMVVHIISQLQQFINHCYNPSWRPFHTAHYISCFKSMWYLVFSCHIPISPAFRDSCRLGQNYLL